MFMKNWTALLWASMALLGCSNTVNPYRTGAQPTMSLHSPGLSDGARVPIFSSFELEAYLHSPFAVHTLLFVAEGNRLWSADTLVITREHVAAALTTAQVSFSDTGWHALGAVALTGSGDTLIEMWRVFAYSPLAPTARVQGDTVTLTAGIIDDRVDYIWQFGNGPTLLAGSPETTVVLDGVIYLSSGSLAVKDGLHRSPPAPFTIDDATRGSLSPPAASDVVFLRDTVVAVDTIRVVVTDTTVAKAPAKETATGDRKSHDDDGDKPVDKDTDDD